MYGASGRGSPVGRIRASAPIHTRTAPNAQMPRRAPCARIAGAKGRLRRRPRTIRSTTPSANGTTARISVSRAVQPLAARSEKNRLSGVRNAPPTLESSELTRASVARPSCPSRSSSGVVSPPPPRSVVTVTADRPAARKRPCSSSANGTPRFTSCAGIDGSAGATPTSSAKRAEAVRTSVRAGETGSSPAMASLGRPRPRSRTTTASASAASGDSATKRAAPAPPNAPASVETRASVCSGRGSGPTSWAANPRASSMSSAVPVAFSPSDSSAPALSR